MAYKEKFEALKQLTMPYGACENILKEIFDVMEDNADRCANDHTKEIAENYPGDSDRQIIERLQTLLRNEARKSYYMAWILNPGSKDPSEFYEELDDCIFAFDNALWEEKYNQ